MDNFNCSPANYFALLKNNFKKSYFFANAKTFWHQRKCKFTHVQ